MMNSFLAADVFVNFDKDFAVIEPFEPTCVDQPYVGPPDGSGHPPCDGFGQRMLRVYLRSVLGSGGFEPCCKGSLDAEHVTRT